VYSCFRSWSRNGLWPALLKALSAQADHEYLMVDSTAVRVHQHGSGPAGGQLAQAMARSHAGLSTKIHMACDALGYPLGFLLTGANVADCDQAPPLLKNHLTKGSLVIMDKGYDSDRIRSVVNQAGAHAAIAFHPRRSRKPPFDQHLYHQRHKIENLFGRLKNFRRISTRYEKLYLHFSSMVSLACVMLWLKL
jgi:transposase